MTDPIPQWKVDADKACDLIDKASTQLFLDGEHGTPIEYLVSLAGDALADAMLLANHDITGDEKEAEVAEIMGKWGLNRPSEPKVSEPTAATDVVNVTITDASLLRPGDMLVDGRWIRAITVMDRTCTMDVGNVVLNCEPSFAGGPRVLTPRWSDVEPSVWSKAIQPSMQVVRGLRAPVRCDGDDCAEHGKPVPS